MTKKSHLYTKTGDKGYTSLLGGQRVSKSHDLLELYGQVDHLNSLIGLLITSLPMKQNLSLEIQFLYSLQSSLFSLGSFFACLPEEREKFGIQGPKKEEIEEVEKKIDLFDQQCPPLKNFILPGGSIGAAYAHLCRTQTRLVERLYVSLYISHSQEKRETEGDLVLLFLNRLSDFFFVYARFLNISSNIEEIVWKIRS